LLPYTVHPAPADEDNGSPASNISGDPPLLDEDGDAPEIGDNIRDSNVEMHRTVDNDYYTDRQDNTDTTTDPTNAIPLGGRHLSTVLSVSPVTALLAPTSLLALLSRARHHMLDT
jgi:hypothetical protein